jgi:hypothetical protein
MFRMKSRPGTRVRGAIDAFRRSAVIVVGAAALLWGAPAFAQGGGCPGSAALKNFKIADNGVSANFLISTTTTTNDTATYFLDTPNESSSGGIPGLIEYCIYPSQPPGNPTSATASYFIFDSGSNQNLFWNVVFHAVQGYFSFKRYDGDPSNVPFDGSTGIQVGVATWSAAASPTGAPSVQTILLHINDPTECQSLYGDGSQTCFVFPGIQHGPPVVQLCNGAPACKDVVIDEAIQTTPLTVPGETLLHIHYTYTIVNQPTNIFNMLFLSPTSSTSDINTGGGKDYFGCEQQPQTGGQPGAWGVYPNYAPPSPFTLNFVAGNGNGCPQSRFFLQLPVTKKVGDTSYILAPGDSITFTIDMQTRVNKGGKYPNNQEYTACGPHILNSGFTVKWFEGTVQKPGTLFSYSTNINPISVNVVSGGNLVCPSS